jgi:hypothetical protein
VVKLLAVRYISKKLLYREDIPPKNSPKHHSIFNHLTQIRLDIPGIPSVIYGTAVMRSYIISVVVAAIASVVSGQSTFSPARPPAIPLAGTTPRSFIFDHFD